MLPIVGQHLAGEARDIKTTEHGVRADAPPAHLVQSDEALDRHATLTGEGAEKLVERSTGISSVELRFRPSPAGILDLAHLAQPDLPHVRLDHEQVKDDLPGRPLVALRVVGLGSPGTFAKLVRSVPEAGDELTPGSELRIRCGHIASTSAQVFSPDIGSRAGETRRGHRVGRRPSGWT